MKKLLIIMSFTFSSFILNAGDFSKFNIKKMEQGDVEQWDILLKEMKRIKPLPHEMENEKDLYILNMEREGKVFKLLWSMDITEIDSFTEEEKNKAFDYLKSELKSE